MIRYRRYSIKVLNELSNCVFSIDKDFVINEKIISRCESQISRLNKPFGDGPCDRFDSRPINTLLRVYSDTCSSLKVYSLSNTARNVSGTKQVMNAYEMLCARHSLTIETFSDAIFKTVIRHGHACNSEMINDFIRTHISIWVLLQHGYVLAKAAYDLDMGMSGNTGGSSSGCIDTETDLYSLCDDAKFQVTALSEHNYNRCPVINIAYEHPMSVARNIITIPAIIRFVSLELLKNAVHATILKYPMTEEMPSVEMIISASKDSVSISVKDSGGGVWNNASRIRSLQDTFLLSAIEKVSHTMSDCKKSAVNQMHDSNVSYQPMSPVLTGLGVGLYLSTAYATHFGGSLNITNNESVGAVATFTIPRNLDIDEMKPTGCS